MLYPRVSLIEWRIFATQKLLSFLYLKKIYASFTYFGYFQNKFDV